MSTQPARKKTSLARRLRPGNTMAFPRELRDAIPDLPTCIGRVLKVDSIQGHSSDTQLFGPRVHLKVVVKETGKLTGEWAVRIDLEVDAARAWAATLTQLADQVQAPAAS